MENNSFSAFSFFTRVLSSLCGWPGFGKKSVKVDFLCFKISSKNEVKKIVEWTLLHPHLSNFIDENDDGIALIY